MTSCKSNHTVLRMLVFGLFFGLAYSPLIVSAVYEAGHGALQLWNAEAQENLPQWIKVWLMTMISVFALGVLFVWNHVEARWLVGGVISGLLFTKFAVPAFGWLPLSGLVALVHLIFWSPALYLMLKNRPFTKGLSLYSVWSGLATFCILFSFVFDVRDAAIYLLHLTGF